VIGVCTDSSAQLPAGLAARFGIEVVPLTITIDGIDYLEGVSLDADEFYAHFASAVQPVVSTSPPSPGQFAAAFDDLIGRGCTEILSVHPGADVSGTLNAARRAVVAVPVPVRLVDSGTVGFGVSCCAWAAAQAIADGATLEQSALVAEQLSPSIGNAFVVGALTQQRNAAGRPDQPLAVHTMRSQLEMLTSVPTMLEAINAMASYAIGWGSPVRVAVGHSDAATEPLADALEEAVGEAADVLEVVRFRVGYGAGPLTGPGTIGCYVFPS
jgi:fatty acid-binding protein DegV